MAEPTISVVVPSHGRRLRLQWLLNALTEQTLPREHWEVVVVHDYDDRDTREVIEAHPLHTAGVLRQLRIPPGTGAPARQRNLGWRAARAPLVLFTDDDCRPAPDWIERALEAARAHPGAIVQGTVRPDPAEQRVAAAPHHRSLSVDPPGPFAQTANIAYPREVLERCGGFDETFPGAAGEDLDLALRARGLGARYAGAPGAVVYHAVEAFSLLGMLRLNLKWREVAYVVKRHPETRRLFVLGVFWRPAHARLCLALAGLALARRHRALALLAAPYVRSGATLELPGRVIVDAAEVATLVWGSARYRTLVL